MPISSASWEDLQGQLQQWLEQTANVRVHATTGEVPRERYAREEKACMGAYLSPQGIEALQVDESVTRKADKYSVPLAYQRSRMGVREENGQMLICDLNAGDIVARHALVSGSCGAGCLAVFDECKALKMKGPGNRQIVVIGAGSV